MNRIIVLVILFFAGIQLSAQQSILGKWTSIDDKTGKPRSYVQIYETTSGKVEGKILQTIPIPGEPADPVCVDCPKDDARYYQKVNGMVIITKMDPTNNLKSAKGGRILDPESGNEYGCILTLTENGEKLKVRGFLGLKALGRTQVWKRTK